MCLSGAEGQTQFLAVEIGICRRVGPCRRTTNATRFTVVVVATAGFRPLLLAVFLVDFGGDATPPGDLTMRAPPPVCVSVRCVAAGSGGTAVRRASAALTARRTVHGSMRKGEWSGVSTFSARTSKGAHISPRYSAFSIKVTSFGCRRHNNTTTCSTGGAACSGFGRREGRAASDSRRGFRPRPRGMAGTAAWALEKVLRGHKEGVTCCEWSRDGTQLASVSAEAVRVWRVDEGRETSRMPEGHVRGAKSCSWSRTGLTLAIASLEKFVRVWSVDSSHVFSVEGHGGAVFMCAWSPDGSRLVSASRDKTLRVWNMNSGSEFIRRRALATLEGHDETVYSCAWSPDSLLLASSSGDDTVRIWNTVTWCEVAKLEGHGDIVHSCAWKPDGTQLASASKDKTAGAYKLTLVHFSAPRKHLLRAAHHNFSACSEHFLWAGLCVFKSQTYGELGNGR